MFELSLTKISTPSPNTGPCQEPPYIALLGRVTLNLSLFEFPDLLKLKIKAFESKVQYPLDVHVADVNPPKTEFDVVLIIVTVFE